MTARPPRPLAIATLASSTPCQRLFLTVTDVARLLACDPRTVRQGIAAGTIPSVRIGNTIRIPAASFYALAGIPPETGGAA